MTKFELYTRVLTELHPRRNERTQIARLNLQDVLIELRRLAAEERGDELGQETQDAAESLAYFNTLWQDTGGSVIRGRDLL